MADTISPRWPDRELEDPGDLKTAPGGWTGVGGAVCEPCSSFWFLPVLPGAGKKRAGDFSSGFPRIGWENPPNWVDSTTIIFGGWRKIAAVVPAS